MIKIIAMNREMKPPYDLCEFLYTFLILLTDGLCTVSYVVQLHAKSARRRGYW